MPKIFLILGLLASLIIPSMASDWFDDVNSPTATQISSNVPLKDTVGNKIHLIMNDGSGNFNSLKWNNGWLLIEDSCGNQYWVNSEQVIRFNTNGKIGENLPSQGMSFGILSLLAIVSVVLFYRRQH